MQSAHQRILRQLHLVCVVALRPRPPQRRCSRCPESGLCSGLPSERLFGLVGAPGLRAHATQVVVGDGVFALSNGVWHLLRTTEHYHLAVGQARPGADDGPETDLFAGLA